MAIHLKGEDAQVHRTCRELQLQPSLRTIYDNEESVKHTSYGLMLDPIEVDPNDRVEDWGDTLYLGGAAVNKGDDALIERSEWVAEKGIEGEHITWISPFSERNRLRDPHTTYRNEVS